MVRKFFKGTSLTDKFHDVIVKYKIPRAFLSVNRHAVSKGMMVGLFVAFIPMPMQMLAIVFLQPLFRFNLPLAVALVWITNPVTMPFIYYVEYVTGGWLLHYDSLQPVHMSVEWFRDNFDNIMVPLYTGTLFYSTIFAALGYYTVQCLWVRSVRRHRAEELARRAERDRAATA